MEVTKRTIMKAVFIKIKIGKSGGSLTKCFQKTDGHQMPVKALQIAVQASPISVSLKLTKS